MKFAFQFAMELGVNFLPTSCLGRSIFGTYFITGWNEMENEKENGLILKRVYLRYMASFIAIDSFFFHG